VSNNIDVSDDLLIALAGEGAFGRGKGYFQQGLVRSWKKSGQLISADVEGSELYRVTLRHTVKQFEGSCDCPASQGFDFCKHCVAVAMAYRQDSQQQAQLEGGDSSQRIKAYLNKLDPEQLRKELLQLIDDDRQLRQQWSVRADVALNKMDHKAIKKRITAAIPYKRNLYSYAQSRAYFAGVEAVVNLLQQQAESLGADKTLPLVDYALLRIGRALSHIDDSGGFREDVVQQLYDMQRQSILALAWEAEKLVNYLLERDASDTSDISADIPSDYAELLGEEGLTLIYSALQSQWDALPKLPKGAGWEREYEYLTLLGRLRRRAEELGDKQGVIRLLEKTATEERDFLGLCGLCIDAEAWGQAEAWLARVEPPQAPRGMARFDGGNQQYQRLNIILQLQRGEEEAALAGQWGIYRQTLAVDDYDRLLELERRLPAVADTEQACGQRVLDYLQENLGKDADRFYLRSHADGLFALYIHLQLPQLALDLAESQRVDSALQEKLAKELHGLPAGAISLYHRVAAAYVEQTNNRAYQQAVALIKRSQCLLSTSELRQQFETSIASLRLRFKAKRNFIGYLGEALDD